MSRPEVGDLIRVYTGEGEIEQHVCTVRDLLSTQMTCVYEWQRPDGGWNERTLFVFYADAEWDAAKREWIGNGSRWL
jgi:hypothetical protein